MKKAIGLLLTITVLMMGMVTATTTTLSEPVLNMGYQDAQMIEFCTEGPGPTIDVVISPVCKDVNGIYGCQAGDIFNPPGYAVTSNMSTLILGECAQLTITTNLQSDEGGVFYYTANGVVGDTTVGSETGKTLVEVPEFGAIAALGVLGLAGLYIYKKRN